jgi:hypothetical protein
MHVRCLDLYQFCLQNKLILHGPRRTKNDIFILLILHEVPLQLAPSLYLNPLSCIVHLCSVLYYFTLSNSRRFNSPRGKGRALAGGQWVNLPMCLVDASSCIVNALICPTLLL